MEKRIEVKIAEKGLSKEYGDYEQNKSHYSRQKRLLIKSLEYFKNKLNKYCQCVIPVIINVNGSYLCTYCQKTANKKYRLDFTSTEYLIEYPLYLLEKRLIEVRENRREFVINGNVSPNSDMAKENEKQINGLEKAIKILKEVDK